MKNKNIVKSFNKIVPTKTQKEKMLTSILAKKENSFSWSKFFLGCRAISVVALVLLVCVVALPKEDGSLKLARNTPSPTAYRAALSFVQQDDTYVALSQLQEIKNVGEYLFTITSGDTMLLGLSVYEDLTNSEHVLVFIEDQYQIFERNVEEER